MTSQIPESHAKSKGPYRMDYQLLAPGPVNLHPKVREILSQPMIHHRTREFDRIFSEVRENIQFIFASSNPVYFLTATGSGGMEAALVNTLSPGEEVLVVEAGKFGQRWTQMAQAFGLKVKVISVPWGEAADPNQIKREITPQTKALFIQACETSTGVSHPIEAIGGMLKTEFPDLLFIVDGITAVGAYPILMDDWGIDVLIAGSQKAFMLPTGMSFLAFSKKAEGHWQSAKMPRYYFDIREEHKANLKGETWFSSNVNILRALDWVLKKIKEMGLKSHFDFLFFRAQLMQEFLRLANLKSFTKFPSPSLSIILLPESLHHQPLVDIFEKNWNITLMGGQDALKGKVLRVGHMGHITPEAWLYLMEALYTELVLKVSPQAEKKIGTWQDLAKQIKENPYYLQWKKQELLWF